MKAPVDFGFGDIGLDDSDFESPDKVIQFGVSPLRVDLMTLISGVDWEIAYKGSKEGFYGTVKV